VQELILSLRGWNNSSIAHCSPRIFREFGAGIWVITDILLEHKLPNFDSRWFVRLGTTFMLDIPGDKIVYWVEIIPQAERVFLDRI
jgi:hypothetical protein